MTVKEIADLLKLSERGLRKRIKKLGELSSPNFDSIRGKLDNAIKGEPAELSLDETLAIVKVEGKDEILASLLAENAANKNALTVRNGDSDRLDRIEKAVCQIAQRVNQIVEQDNYGEPKLLLENKHDKVWCFLEFITKNIFITSASWPPVKRVEIWDRYTEMVKKADRMVQKEFFEMLARAYPVMKMVKPKSNSQYFCYCIDLTN